MSDIIAWYRERGIICGHAPSLGGIFRYEPTIRFFGHTSLNQSAMGAYSYTAGGCSLIEAMIGRYCSIGASCNIGLSLHPIDHLTSSPFPYEDVFQVGSASDPRVQQTNKISIGHDVWIGTGTKIIGGNEIGHGAIIGAGSIVTKDVPPFAIVAGNPAKLKRLRFDEKAIERLLALKWWDYDLVDANKRGISVPWQTPLKAADAIETGIARGEIKPIQAGWHQVKRSGNTIHHEIQKQ